MEHRRLGASGLKISELAYGNWITHGGQVAEDAAVACVHAALDGGITTFDTADVYAGTQAEVILGKALAGQRREGLEIFSKVYWPVGTGANDRGLSRKHIIEGCHGSLRRLGVDYLDLYQAHRYDYDTPLEETLRAFDDLVRQGKVLYVGVSEWRAEEIEAAVKLAAEMGFDLIVSNQPQYSALWRVIEAEVDPVCRRYGIGQVVWSPLAQGVLTGKYLPGQPPPPGSRATSADGSGFMERWLQDDVLAAVQQLQPLAADLGLSMGQLALVWVLANDNVSAAIIGASRPEQVQDSVQASGVTLSADVKAKIDAILAPVAFTDPSLTASPRRRP
jgi:aryl-alcohol dehydrogenase-like predicted oxidoreductase